MNNITQYLTDNSYFNTIQEIENNPAILFTAVSPTSNKLKSASVFEDVYLFKNFGLEKTNTIKASSGITTHYMEDNTAMQDHWAINPITYTASGVIGEVIYSPPVLWSSFVQEKFTDYLTPLNVLSPTFDNYTRSAINTVQAVEASVRRYRQILTQTLNSFQGAGINTNIIKHNQSRVFEWLQILRDNRQLVTVLTPYGRFDNLAINDFGLTQNDSKYQSDIEIQFIQWRNVSSIKRSATEEEQAYFFQCQNTETEQNGTASTENVSELKQIYKYKTKDFWGNPIQ